MAAHSSHFIKDTMNTRDYVGENIWLLTFQFSILVSEVETESSLKP